MNSADPIWSCADIGWMCVLFFFSSKDGPQCRSFCQEIHSKATVHLVLPDRIEVQLDVFIGECLILGT